MKEKTFEWYFVQLRRIEEHREADSEKVIRKIYKHLLKELRGFLGNAYARHADSDDKLTYAILQQKGMHARFLEEVEQRISRLSPRITNEIRALVEDMYRLAYDGMRDAVKNSANMAALHGALDGAAAASPEVIKRAVENPVAGLTLKDTLERNRQNIVYDIKRQIGVGLMNGDRMSTMARRISKSIEHDYRKSMVIARTEAHRIREAGHCVAALSVDEAARAGGLRMMKTWQTMNDNRVRPYRGEGEKKSGKANHVDMKDITIPVDALFDLGRGVETLSPGQSDNAENDINCRCFLTYALEPDENK